MINWDKPLVCDHGAVIYNSDGDHNGVRDVRVRSYGDDSIQYWVYDDGTPVSNILGIGLSVRNVKSRQQRIIEEIQNAYNTTDMFIHFIKNVPELKALLDELDK